VVDVHDCVSRRQVAIIMIVTPIILLGTVVEIQVWKTQTGMCVHTLNCLQLVAS
jgi:hypothetical protein